MSRTNVDIAILSPGNQNRKLFQLNGTPISETNTEYDQTYFAEKRVSSVTPGYRAARRRREDLPMNPFLYEKSFWSSPYGIQEIITPNSNLRQLDVGSNIGGGWEWDPLILTSEEKESVNDAAANKLLHNLKDMKVNIGAAFAERRQTAQLFSDTVKRIGNSLGSLKSGNYKAAAQWLSGTRIPTGPSRPRPSGKVSQSKALANDWLSLQFGWLPLAKDLYGSLETLAAHADRLSRVRVSASVTKRWSRLGDVFGSQWDGVPNGAHRYGNYTAKYVCVFSYSHLGLNDLASVGITNPVSVAWEVLPWSFIIDWFIPIGRYIDLWDATLGITFEKGSFTTFEKGYTRYSCYGRRLDPSTGREVFLNAKASATRVRCVREPISGFPHPTLPAFAPSIGSTRAASALALIRQRLRT